MNLAEHIAEHAALGLEFRFPAEGNTYLLFSATSVKLYIGGVLKAEWTT